MTYLNEILFLLGDDRRKLPMLVLMFIGISILDLAGLGLIGPYVAAVVDPTVDEGALAEIINLTGLPRERSPLLITLGLVLASIFLVKAIFAIGINYVIINFSQQQKVRLGSHLMHTYQALPYTEYLQRNSAEYIRSIQELTGHFAGVVLIGLRMISDGIIAVVILIFLASVHGQALAFLVGILGLMIFGYDRGFRRRLQSLGEISNLASKQGVQSISEGIEGLKEIRVLGAEDYFHQKVLRTLKKFAYTRTRQLTLMVVPRYLLELAMVSFIVGLVGVILLSEEELMSVFPILGVFGVAGLRLTPTANTLSTSLVDLRFRRNAISLLYRDISHYGPFGTVNASRIDESPVIPFDELSIEHISFRYPDASMDTLQDVSFHILAGESIGLIGPSGSGKTTLVDVVLGLLEPREGQIRYNGTPLAQALKEWRSRVAYLPQQIFLTDDSLRCNVALGVDEQAINQDRLNKAISRAQLTNLVKQLPEGLDTLIGERGVRLSGGQRQRVAIARAFYYGRSVLVMDEATSALDHETEREIIEEIKLLKGRVTMIVIAHRLTTVQPCDRIYRLDSGGLVESDMCPEI